MNVTTANELLSIVIVSYNTRTFLRGCLQALERYPAAIPQQIVIVDNASSDGTQEMVRREFPDCTLVALEENVGYGGAVNRGVRHARGNWLLLLNPDAEVSGGALDKLLQFARANPRAGVVGPRLVHADGQPQASAKRDISPLFLLLESSRLHLLLPSRVRGRLMLGTYFPQNETTQAFWISGACHLIPMKVWQEVGSLTEETFCGSDDYDYCYRVRKKGYQVWLYPEAIVTHYCSVAVRDRWSPWEVEELAVHNFYVVMESHLPAWRVKTYAGAEVLCWLAELFRHQIQPNGVDPQLAAGYRERLFQRLNLHWDIFLGRLKPIRRCQPASKSRVVSPTAADGIGR